MDDLTEILRQCVLKNASDLHLVSNEFPRMRLLGELLVLDNLDKDVFSEKQIIELISPFCLKEGINLEELKLLKKEMDFSFAIKDIGRFRVNIFQQSFGISVAIRILSNQIPSFESLGLSKTIKEFILNQNHGLILVTGATGSGKSTTLASIINEINQFKRKHILTLEDPIEFYHQSNNCLIQQRQIKHHTQSFQSALKAALREDPDIILIGELRDLDSIRLALEASETGHLVLATLHTNSAIKSIDRIIQVFGEKEKNQIRMMLSESLKMVISQQLINLDKKSRKAVFEILMVDAAVSNLIRENKLVQINSVIETNKKKGMQTMNQALKEIDKSFNQIKQAIF